MTQPWVSRSSLTAGPLPLPRLCRVGTAQDLPQAEHRETTTSLGACLRRKCPSLPVFRSITFLPHTRLLTLACHRGEVMPAIPSPYTPTSPLSGTFPSVIKSEPCPILIPCYQFPRAAIKKIIIIPQLGGVEQQNCILSVLAARSPGSSCQRGQTPSETPAESFLAFSWLMVVVVILKSYLTLCNPMDCSTPSSPVLHYLPEFAQTHVH